VQFHPESIASEHGFRILKNFLDIAAQWNAETARCRWKS
jgi:anthranilate synthase component II